ncbi:Tannase/feruloyl esterase [Microdochium trichocladiopsis]|uniref:Carboxylic ester hydrolase n=1 Tax=Microdochium trichocladiopsis TaxID=1682393 RepID=A0A9P9BKM1_9PEZI|nr:Tannase/feruloyl esterase [Microdochium trichocladiopsis]KAH7021389.1 Tannase/feruloyl esterase [Microdochium trichocladiopsis]
MSAATVVPPEYGAGVSSFVENKLCSADTFANIRIEESDNTPPVEIITVVASLANVTEPRFAFNAWPINDPATTEVCNVTITYTHPGWDDTINNFVQLPVSRDWNDKVLGIGGGGWRAGNIADLAYATAKGFVGVTTDAGHSLDSQPVADWALTDDGTSVNWHLLQDFAGIALHDAGKLGKKAAAAFYGSGVQKSYFTGCSTGGRQGHMLAQKFPDVYDGILATAPAINWDRFLPGMYWPFIVMKEIGYFPPPCELDAITKAAVSFCDGIDGVTDTITVDHDKCSFDPESIVGQEVVCPDLGDRTITISREAAKIASAIWDGPRKPTTTHDESSAGSNNKKLWHGLSKTASLLFVAGTECQANSTCSPAGFHITIDWLRTFLSADKSLDPATLTWAEYTDLFEVSTSQFESVIGTSDANLERFAQRGGKLLTWHGLVDQLIPPLGTRDYYERVVASAQDQSAAGGGSAAHATTADYFRYFEAPGVEHCAGGEGWFPGGALDALIDWVEHDRAPETLYAENSFASASPPGSRAVNLCLYPKKLRYLGGNADQAEAWGCGDSEPATQDGDSDRPIPSRDEL